MKAPLSRRPKLQRVLPLLFSSLSSLALLLAPSLLLSSCHDDDASQRPSRGTWALTVALSDDILTRADATLLYSDESEGAFHELPLTPERMTDTLPGAWHGEEIHRALTLHLGSSLPSTLRYEVRLVPRDTLIGSDTLHYETFAALSFTAKGRTATTESVHHVLVGVRGSELPSIIRRNILRDTRTAVFNAKKRRVMIE